MCGSSQKGNRRCDGSREREREKTRQVERERERGDPTDGWREREREREKRPDRSREREREETDVSREEMSVCIGLLGQRIHPPNVTLFFDTGDRVYRTPRSENSST